MLKWVFPNVFFLFNIQSMRSTACVKVQIIWTCTSRWSGSITSTARSCQLFKSMYLNIQREYLRNGLLPCLPLWPRCWCYLCTLFDLQLVWAICHHVVGWEWRSLQRFSAWSPGEGQKRWGNCFLSSLLCKMLTRWWIVPNPQSDVSIRSASPNFQCFVFFLAPVSLKGNTFILPPD